MVCIVSEKKSQSSLFLITGSDEKRIADEAEALFTQIAGSDPDPFATEIIREDDRGPMPELITRVIDAIQTPSFLGGSKVVWLRHFHGFEAEPSGKGGTDRFSLGVLVKVLSQPLPPDITLILDGPGCDARKQLYKTCDKHGTVKTFAQIAMGKGRWRESVGEAIRECGGRLQLQLSHQVVEALIDSLGTNTSLIEVELQKLSCYVGPGQAITVDDVQLLCPPYCEQESWAIGDPIGKRNVPEVLSMVERLLSRTDKPDENARLMLNQIGRLFTQWLAVRLTMAENRLKTSMALKEFVATLSAEQKQELSSKGDKVVTMNMWRAKFMADNALNYTPSELIAGVCVVRDALLSIVLAGVPGTVALENALMQILPRRR